MSDQSPWFSLAEEFERLQPPPTLTIVLTPKHHQSALSHAFWTSLYDNIAWGFWSQLPGSEFGLECHDDIPVQITIKPNEVSRESEALNQFYQYVTIAGRDINYASKNKNKCLTNKHIWFTTLIREALCKPGRYLRPESEVYVQIADNFKLTREAMIACRDRKVRFPMFNAENLPPPWPLHFKMILVHKASAELCRRLAGVGIAQAIKTDALARPPGKPEPEFCLRRDGDGWFIRAFGKEGHFKNRKGFHYIALLIERAGKPVPMAEFIAKAEGHSPDPKRTPLAESWQPVLDREAKQSLKDHLVKLTADIKQAEERGDFTSADVLRKEFERLSGYLLADTQPNGKAKSFSTTSKRMAEAVRKAISRVCDALRQSGFDKLADHFEAYISAEEFSYVYRPPASVTWALL